MLLYGIKMLRIIVTISLIFGLYVCSSCKSTYYPEADNLLEKMVALSENSSTVTVFEVFGFDFDKAYLPDSRAIYADKDYFLQIMNVKSEIDIPQFPSEEYRRILFVKNNEIIYDFVYTEQQLQLSKDNAWIYPNTKVSFNTSPSSDHIQVSLD